MTSYKQIRANRLNALKSTGPRTERGKWRSRQNAMRHGLTAETVITALEDAADYQMFEMRFLIDYQPRSATERELVARLASLFWRLRRSTRIETALFQIEGELMRDRAPRRRRATPPPEWQDELDSGSTTPCGHSRRCLSRSLRGARDAGSVLLAGEPARLWRF